MSWINYAYKVDKDTNDLYRHSITKIDPRDPAAVDSAAHALENLSLNQDSTFVGMSSNENILYNDLVTFAPPDVTSNTRILAVCGLMQEEAGPAADGWFLADMMAYWALFGGKTESQLW